MLFRRFWSWPKTIYTIIPKTGMSPTMRIHAEALSGLRFSLSTVPMTPNTVSV